MVAAPIAGAAGTDLASQSQEALTRLKLAEEVEKLEHDNDAAAGISGFFVRFAPFLTALVAVGGLAATIWKQSSDQSTQRTRDREAQQIESERRVEDRFATVLTELGSDTDPTKASAAASLVTYLRPEYRRFHHQVRIAVLTHVKLDQTEPIRKLLARLYGAALQSGAPVDEFERDLSRAKLANTDLSDLELRGADLAFAELNDAILLGSDLYRAQGLEVKLAGARLGAGLRRHASLIEVRFLRADCRGADFSGALLVNAHLKEADLRDARFFQARLQAAHLEAADLRGAQFHQANLADTYFYAATFDERALRSVTRAVNWRNAHFDSDVESALQSLAET